MVSTANVTHHSVSTADGRSLQVADAGDPAGKPILFHLGTPSSGRLFEPHVRVAAKMAVRLVSYTRPGYGGSTRMPGRCVADAAADVLAVADALEIDRFGTYGISGGGPHALACAARGRGRVAAAATIAGVGPFDAPDLDWLEDMGAGNVEELAIAQQGEQALRTNIAKMRAGFEGLTLQEFVESMRPFLSDVDAAILDDEIGAYFFESFRESLARGVDGWVDDDFAFIKPWGFELEEIDVPVLVLQGRRDLMVPYGHGAWLAANVPGAEADLREREGHLTLVVRETPRVWQWLLERL